MDSVLARSPVPRYVQIADLFRQRIARGGWCAGTRVPSNEELMREFDVSRITIRQAVDVLARDGLLEARQGSGTFVLAKSGTTVGCASRRALPTLRRSTAIQSPSS